MANTTNLTDILLEDPFKDVNLENETSSHVTTLEKVGEIWMLITIIIKYLLCVVNVSAGLFLAVIIMKFKRLKTRVNIYLFHYSVCIALYYLFAPIVYIFFALVGVGHHRVIYCTLDTFEDVFLILSFIFAGIAAVECYVVHLKESLSVFYKRTYKYLIVLIYTFGLLKLLVRTSFCLSENSIIKHHITIAVYVICFIMINILNIYEYNKRKFNHQERIRYPLIIANIIFYVWLPLFLSHMLDVFLPEDYLYAYAGRMLIIFTDFIPQFLAHSHAIVVVYMLGRLNKHFKMAYTIALKKKFKNYEHNDLDQSDEEDTVHHQVNGRGNEAISTEESNRSEEFTEVTLI